MGVLDVPVAVQAAKKYGLCASVIQSSVYRELGPLADLTRVPLPEIDLFCRFVEHSSRGLTR